MKLLSQAGRFQPFTVDERTTLFLIKPDGIKRKLVKKIEQMLGNAGFTIVARVKKHLTIDDVRILYKTTFDEDYPMGVYDPRVEKHIEYMRSGPCLALLTRHKEMNKPELYSYARLVRGEDWIPYKCSSGSIRYALRDTQFDNYELILDDGFLVNDIPHSVVHAALSDLELAHSVSVFFSGKHFDKIS